MCTVKIKIRRNGDLITEEVESFDTVWEAATWSTRQTTASFGDDLAKVRMRRTKESVTFDDNLDITKQHQESVYKTETGKIYRVEIDFYEES